MQSHEATRNLANHPAKSAQQSTPLRENPMQAMTLIEESLAQHDGPACDECRAELRHIQDMSEYYPNDILVMLDRWTARLRKEHSIAECGACPATRFRAWDLDAG